MKKICVITSTRAEYGSLKWLMEEIEASPNFHLQIIVSGAHLMKEQGYTINEIIEDGFYINEKVDAEVDSTSPGKIAESMGRIAKGMAVAFEKLDPDFIVVLGDRYELLPICSTAFVMRKPIIHIAGGDITEGAIDNGIRNAITMLSNFHFTSTDESRENVIRMRGSSNNVWAVGALELDAIYRETPISRDELGRLLGINGSMDWGLLTYHAETINTLDYNLQTIKNIIRAVCQLSNFQIIATYSNADFGGSYINELLQETGRKMPDKFKVIPSLGNKRFLSFMRQVSFVIGNSSSGITEAPILGVYSVNIGDRQKGRHQCSNVIQCTGNFEEIKKAIKIALDKKILEDDLTYWGDGHACERIIKILSGEL